ncbi:MAG: pseudouridine synthase, partial [Lachnospiraceae bacterium]|nr:pseudouridine synthase [Lachnospiraceae bacterium]
NKPVGVVCTTREFRGEENILSLVDYAGRLYPVGRLDKDSEGLIFLTNDGAFAAEITKASGRHEKEYEVTVSHDITDSFLKRMEKGIYLSDLDKTTAACKVKKTGDRRFSIILTQGLNRQIRRMCETCGYDVKSLKRVRIMNVELGKCEPGSWRFITGAERAELLQGLKTRPKSGRQGAGKTEKKQGKKTDSGRQH